jgi:peptidase C10 family
MKQFLIISILAVMVAACSSEEPMPVTDNSTQQGSIKVTVEEAIKIANQAAEAFDAKSARGVSRRASSAAMVDVLGAKNGRSGGIDTLLYMVNYDNKQGYAIVSASRACETLLGIVDEGEFNALEAAENPSYSYYLANAQNYVASTLGATFGGGKDPITPGFIEETRFVHEDYPVKVNVKWGQRYPEGYFCPNKISGCVQTAMAQIMSYLKLPTSISLTYPERDVDVQVLDWENMTKHTQSVNTTAVSLINSHNSSCAATEASHMAIARLCRELGYRNNASYYDNATGAFDYKALQTFRQLVTEKEISNFTYLGTDYSTLFDAIKTGIGYISGSDTNGAGGHAWVIDGGRRIGKIVTVSGPGTIGIDGKEHPFVRDYTTHYYHFNWGWNGTDNGYFEMGVFDTSKGEVSPGVAIAGPGIGSRANYDFSNSVGYFIIK